MERPDPGAESRRRPRFVVTRRVEGRFAGFDVVIHDISESGCQFHHLDPLKLGSSGALQFDHPDGGDHIEIRGQVVWSRLAKEPEDGQPPAYVSAVRFTGIEEPARTSLARFVASCAHYDPESMERKRAALARKDEVRRSSMVMFKSRSEIPPEMLKRILDAREWLLMNPAGAVKWYQRARFSREQLRGAPLPHQDEVLAVWEVLDRKYPIAVIALALTAER